MLELEEGVLWILWVAEHPSLILMQGTRDMSHYQIWMPVLKSPWLKATTWTENQQVNHHNSFLINLEGENHRKAVIGSSLVPHHTLVLSFGLLSCQSHWLLLWRLWLQLLSFSDLIIWAKLHLSQDFCINPKMLQAVKKKKGDKSELGRILISEGILLDSRKLDFQILNGSRVLFYVFNWIQISDMLKVGMGNYDFYICCVNGW